MSELIAYLDGEAHIFTTHWSESVCKMILADLNKMHCRIELFGNTVSYQRAWRFIEEYFS